MTGLIEVGLPDEITELIRLQIRSFRHRNVDLTDDGLWRLRLAASPEEDVARDFSDLTAATINSQRAADLDTLDAGLGESQIDVESAHAWIRALNQLRLVAGTDLAVTDDDSWRPAPGDETFAHAIVYDLLTQLQTSLIDAVSEVEGFG